MAPQQQPQYQQQQQQQRQVSGGFGGGASSGGLASLASADLFSPEALRSPPPQAISPKDASSLSSLDPFALTNISGAGPRPPAMQTGSSIPSPGMRAVAPLSPATRPMVP